MKSPLKKLQEALWKECRRITFNKYGNTCYTCGATNLVAGNLQLGHFIPNSTCGAFLRYDLRNLRPQCMRCNIHGGGQGAEFYRQMESEVGKKAVNKLFQERDAYQKISKQKIVKASDHYAKLLEEYKKL